MDDDVVFHNYRSPELKLPNAVIEDLAKPRENIPSKFVTAHPLQTRKWIKPIIISNNAAIHGLSRGIT